ncbi:MAG: outer membrane beta-barrel protein, partial [Segetibacter sp.]
MIHQTANQRFALLFLSLMIAGVAGNAQKINRTQPKWWFGESGAANFNTYRGTTQMITNNLMVPAAFHKGDGIKTYASLLTEYRPNKVLGGMLNVAYDNRGGSFDSVMAPCNCGANLSTNLSYITIEPSIRIAPFSSAFYLFAGPTIGFNVSKAFTYTQAKQTDKRGDLSDVRKTVFSAQAGAGIDIPISAKASATQWTLSPFASFQTNLGQAPRSVGSWSLYTVHTGIALKFGTSKKATPVKTIAEPVNTPVVAAEKEIQFSVRAPKVVPLSRKVKETFALRNSVFFNQGSTEIPTRYTTLSSTQAIAFKEGQLQQDQPNNLNNGRSSRQLEVYHNILNILGDRLRSNPQSTISLSGASDKNPSEGKLMAENVKQYIVAAFGINA